MAVDQQLINDACDALNVTLLGTLRDGGQKTVRVVESGDTRQVLKVVSVGSSSPDALRRAQREVELLQSIDSDHLVKVTSELVELGTPVRGAAWLEELLEGEDLSDAIGLQWSWHATKEMALQLARGLSALHDASVVHRDLSANNVRRVSTNAFKIMDPGFARHTLRSGMTVGGQPGTPGFMSPEHLQLYSGGPTPSSDVFQVGILMYLALTSEVPIPYRGDDADYVARLSAVAMTPLRNQRQELPAKAYEVVDRCLHKQPARRYLNGHYLADAIGNS